MSSQPRLERPSLARYPLTTTMPTRFNDVDSLGHVNNVAIAAYYEAARSELMIGLFGRRHLIGPSTHRFVLAKTEITYLAEARFPAVYTVGTGVTALGTTSFTLAAGLFLDGECYGTSEAVMVHTVDGHPSVLGPEQRRRLEGIRLRGAQDRAAAAGAAAGSPGRV